ARLDLPILLSPDTAPRGRCATPMPEGNGAPDRSRALSRIHRARECQKTRITPSVISVAAVALMEGHGSKRSSSTDLDECFRRDIDTRHFPNAAQRPSLAILQCIRLAAIEGHSIEASRFRQPSLI